MGSARAINDLGQVIGNIDNQAIIWTPENNITYLALEESNLSYAIDINQVGHVVGRYQNPTIVGQRSFFWSEETGFMDNETLGGYTQGLAINDSGEIVGTSLNSTGSMEAFIWSIDHGIIGLGIGDGNYSTAHDVNNFGHVLGRMYEIGGEIRIFIWSQEDGMQYLNAVTDTEAYVIGDGHIVGVKRWEYSGGIEYHATLWKFQVNAPPEAQIDLIISEIDSLIVNGVINNGQGNALISKLEAAKKQLDKDNINTTCNLLRAFENQVQAFISSGNITPEEGETLLGNVNSLITELGCD